MRKILSFIFLLVVLSACQKVDIQIQGNKIETNEEPAVKQQDKPKLQLDEYCFTPDDYTHLGLVEAVTTPDIYLQEFDYVKAAINGVYFGADDDKSQGIVYFNGQHLGSKKGQITGYLTINKKGEVKVAEYFNGRYADNQLVIGTRPLLVKDGKVHNQAKLEKYNYNNQVLLEAYRSAIGTKDGKNICFAVSQRAIIMSDWAAAMLSAGYSQAINLDGGTISGLAVRQGNEIKNYGGGIFPTRLIIFAY